MKENEFISNKKYNLIDNGNVSSECPSNIALIKYWGKFEKQIPANASLSYTLSNSFTRTKIDFELKNTFSVSVFLDGVENIKFAEKIEKYFISIEKYVPFILKYSYKIYTKNSFPHSSGIASSASGFGALAICLMKMDELFSQTDDFQTEKTSFLARLGSGSASRSLYKGLVVWGENNSIENSSDLYATLFPFEIEDKIKSFCDSILLVHEGEKKVSSTVGHNLMNNHPFAKQRFLQADENIKKIIPIIKEGNLMEFGNIIESEALTLHAMMMTSSPYFILMQPQTVSVIQKIWEFRNDTKLPIFFTLDAGANVHILYPKSIEELAKNFINKELLVFSQNKKVIHDFVQF